MTFEICLLFRALYFRVSSLSCCNNHCPFNIGYILHRRILEYHHEPKYDTSGHIRTLECSPTGIREEVSILNRHTNSKNIFLIKGCRHCKKRSNSHWKRIFRYTLCFVLLLITGVGSWMFHMTLLYEMQLMDELPMVWGASYFVYCQFRVCVIHVLMTS